MNILFKLASRSRPDKLIKCIDNIYKHLSNKEDFEISISLDGDDSSFRDNAQEIYEACKKVGYGKCIPHIGSSKNKIDAINRNIRIANKPKWDILINTSDDMFFNIKGFDDIIRMDMQQNFPDLDGFLHYNDGNQKSNVCTMSIMGRKYFDRFGYIYHPYYKSLWCDVEATEVAYMLGKYKYMGDDKILFRHLHPSFGLCEYDEQYRKTEAPEQWNHDKEVIDYRRSKNYYLDPKDIVNGFRYKNI